MISSWRKPINFTSCRMQKVESFIPLKSTEQRQKVSKKIKPVKLVILYTTNPVQQDSYIKAAAAKGFIVIKSETIVDASFINTMEMKWSDVQFTRGRCRHRRIILLINRNRAKAILNKEEESKLKDLFNFANTRNECKRRG
jgi:molecular chaperone HtpG